MTAVPRPAAVFVASGVNVPVMLPVVLSAKSSLASSVPEMIIPPLAVNWPTRDSGKGPPPLVVTFPSKPVKSNM